MIVKQRDFPLHIQKLNALIRRLSPNHPKLPLIKENLSKNLAGYRGEKAIDYPLSFLPDKDYFILHDLRIPYKEHFFQMDTLVVSKKFLMILEVKNIIGELSFDQRFHQLIRVLDGVEMAFPDPIIQVSLHERQLKEWLIQNRFATVPVYSMVVISNPQTIIRSNQVKNHIDQKVVHSNYIPLVFEKLEKSIPRDFFDEKELRKLIRNIRKQHTIANFDILTRYQLEKSEIQHGVHCPNCEYLPIKRIYGKWVCPSCNLSSKDAHIRTLNDYYLLIDKTITNYETREFLQINNPSLVSRILNSLYMETEGSRKNRIYQLVFKEK